MRIENLKLTYPKGTRVEVVQMNDDQAVPKGTQGTVEFIDDVGTIHVAWDNGSTLGLIVGEDDFNLISKPEQQYEYQKVNLTINTPVVAKDELNPQKHIIKNAVKLSHMEYLKLVHNPVRDREYIEKFAEEMYAEDGVWHSILVYCEEEPDGIVIESEGFKYARYSGHVNNVHSLLETSLVNEQDKNKFEKIKVLVVEPHMKPYVAIIDNDLSASQGMVGGSIETLSLSDTVEMIVNEEGKIKNLPANRRFRNDVIAKRFIIVGVDEGEHFKSLSDKDIKQYSEAFDEIEMIDQKDVQKNMDFDIIF